MKTFLTAVLSVVCIYCFGQINYSPVKVIKVTTYALNGTPSVKLDTIRETYTKLDLAYFAKHYNYPKQWLPDSLKNPIYKSQKVIVDLGGPINSQYHRTKYTVYDSLSRVTTFGTSTCMVCEFSPTEYKVTYDIQGRIEKIAKSYWVSNFQNLYSITYFPSGNVNRFDVFNSGILAKRIESL